MDADSFHRLVKVLADSGEAATLDEAQQMFARYGVRIVLGSRAMSDPSTQIIALTAINTAARSFRGNVQVVAPRDTCLTVPGYVGCTLGSFLEWMGIMDVPDERALSWPTIEVGQNSIHDTPSRAIRPWADGWRFGVGHGGSSTFVFAPACVAAGALAISEAFSLLRRDNPYAGRRHITLSLWSSDSCAEGAGPMDIPPIPSCWLVGLGHLGQAYAWTLGFMKQAAGATLYLQDIDVITKSTLSTSVLSVAADINERKTRAVARWLEARDYGTAIVERRFDEFQRVGAAEPRLALFGVDNAAARRVLEGAGFRLIIDVGLGSGYQDFRAIRLRTFPGPSRAAAIWATSEGAANSQAPAYKALRAQGAEPCGVTTLATRAVGAPFVGCVAAAFVVAELVRSQAGGPAYGYVDLNLRDPQALEAAESRGL
jgi:hypothetical protein